MQINFPLGCLSCQCSPPSQLQTKHHIALQKDRDAGVLPEKSEELSAHLPETIQHMISMKKTEENAEGRQFILSYPELAVVFQRSVLIKTCSLQQSSPSHCRRIPVALMAVSDHS